MNSELFVFLLPLLAIELTLKGVCLKDWLHRNEFKGFGKVGWLLVFLFVTLVGPLAYLVYGRAAYGND